MVLGRVWIRAGLDSLRGAVPVLGSLPGSPTVRPGETAEQALAVVRAVYQRYRVITWRGYVTPGALFVLVHVERRLMCSEMVL